MRAAAALPVAHAAAVGAGLDESTRFSICRDGCVPVLGCVGAGYQGCVSLETRTEHQE
jgi:hypothetical protein